MGEITTELAEYPSSPCPLSAPGVRHEHSPPYYTAMSHRHFASQHPQYQLLTGPDTLRNYLYHVYDNLPSLIRHGT